jgi:hypothetical protein
MTTEGARALSTANLEAVLDALLDDDPRWVWQYEEAARAELAALIEAAGQVAPLRAALSGLLGGIVREARVADNPSLVRATHTLRAVDEATAALLADAGPGASGARDEIERKAAAWDWAWEQSRSDTHPTWFDERGLLGNALAAVDARRAGGAGETDKEG